MKKIVMGVLLCVLAAGAWAQTSRTNAATVGLFSNDADKFMDVNDWSGIQFEKLFAYLQGGNSTNATVSAGLAKHLGALYLGVFYDGNLYGSLSESQEDSNGDDVGNYPTSRKEFTDNLYFLLGTSVGGFRLEINSNFAKTEIPASSSVTTYTTTGDVALELRYGNNFALGAGELRPEAAIRYGLGLAKTETENSTTNITAVDKSNGYSPLNIILKADYLFPETENSQFVLGAENNLGFRIYPDPLIDNGQPIATTTTWDGSYVEEALTLYAKKRYDLDGGFSVAWRLGSSFSLTKIDNARSTHVGSVSTDVANTTTNTTIQITPEARLGLSYRMIPDRFTLNGGVRVTYAYRYYKSTRNDDTPAGTLKETITHTFGYNGSGTRGIVPSAGFGGTLQLTPLAALDFSAGAGLGGNFSVNTTTFAVGVIIRN